MSGPPSNDPMTPTSPLVSPRAGVIGTGFIGPVHVEALRRLGVTVTAICDVADLGAKAAARLAIPQAFADYRELLACPDGGRGPHHHAEPVPLRDVAGRAAGGQTRRLREAAGHEHARDRADREGSARGPEGVRRELQRPVLPGRAAAPPPGRARRTGRHHPRQRLLHAGLAVQGHRLQLAAAAAGGRQAARRGRHRHALDGHRLVHPRREDHVGVRRPGHVAQAARDVPSARCRPSPRPTRR